MTTLVAILTDTVINAAMERAEGEVCPPGEARCDGFPNTVEEALTTLHRDGWCCIGRVAAYAGREPWDGWFHVDRGAVRSIPTTKRR
jgi:hypothetical protein